MFAVEPAAAHSDRMKTGEVCERPFVLLRVLVADNGISAHDSLTALLSEFEGISVLDGAQRPDKVLALVTTTRPDVVILDLQLTNATGLKILKALKRLPVAPIVIVLSHYDLEPFRQAAAAAGADHFLIKTTECGHLEALIREIAQATPKRRIP